MKRKLIFVLAFLLLWPCMATGKIVEMTWDANTESDLAGYRIYSRSDDQPFIRVSDDITTNDQCGPDVLLGSNASIGTQNCVATDSGALYRFVVTAFDTSGNESEVSNEVAYQSEDLEPPGKVLNFQLIGQISQLSDGTTRVSLKIVPMEE